MLVEILDSDFVIWTLTCTHWATSRDVAGSIPGSVTGDFFRGSPDGTMCPGVDSVPENEYQGFILG